MPRAWSKRVLRVLLHALLIALVTFVAYHLHAKSFVAGFIFLFPLMLIAFGWGFLDASIASVFAVLCLDFFFTEPLLHLTMSDPQDWVALIGFEAVVLLVSHLADRLKRHTAEASRQRVRVEKLYRMSRDILLLNRRTAIGRQLVYLILEAFDLDSVLLWDAREERFDLAGDRLLAEEEVQGAFFHQRHSDDPENGRFVRTLFLGARPIGSLGLTGSSDKAFLDGQTADAIASLAALTLERAHSFRSESEAEAARQSEQLRSALLDGLSHAFKTPLTTIQGASSGLLEIGRLEPAQEELVTLINEQALHLTELTTRALQTAKIDGEDLRVSKEEVWVHPLLQEISAQCSRHLSGHRLRVQDQAGGGPVWADARLLKLALLELVDNATKYADPKATITLNASWIGDEITFSVQNEGSYVPPEERLRIFRRFYRSPGSQYRAAGTGIGLSFVKRIVEAHAGHVWVESQQEAGTTFYLSLPASAKGEFLWKP
jgi:two-component system, OmpR family, sensor histidine kinase KdpD